MSNVNLFLYGSSAVLLFSMVILFGSWGLAHLYFKGPGQHFIKIRKVNYYRKQSSKAAEGL